MYAVRLHAFGPAESLSYERTEDPGPGQVRIAVEAAGRLRPAVQRYPIAEAAAAHRALRRAARSARWCWNRDAVTP